MIREFLKNPPFELGVLWTGEELSGKYIVEPKYDGIRVFLGVFENEIIVVTRNGKRNGKLETIIKKHCKLPKNIIFDCEFFYKNWNTSVTFYRNPKEDKINFYVFDFFTLEEYRKRKTPPLILRKRKLEKIVEFSTECHFLKLVNYEMMPFENILKYFNQMLEKGFEGVMVKNPSAEYKFGSRTRDWLKFKKKDKEIWICIGVEEGKKKDTIGALICKTPSGNIVKVGTGFTEKERKLFYKKPPIGKRIEVEVSISPQKKAVAVFPVFIRIVD